MKPEIINKIKDFLNRSGLDDKEIKVYIYLLSTGPQAVSYIGRACNLTRTNTYDIVKKLETHGLCFNLGAVYGKKIKANQPSELLAILNDKEREITALKNEFSGLLPLFDSINSYRPSAQSQVSYFSGQESLRKLIRLSLQAVEKKIRFAGSELDIINRLGQEFLIDYHVRRADKRLFLESLRPGRERGSNEVFKNDLKYFREVRLRPENLIRLKSIIVIWDASVAFCSLVDDISGILIENEALAIMLKSWFDFIWVKSKKI